MQQRVALARALVYRPRVADGQRVLFFVTEPAPVPLAAGQAVRLELPAEAFMLLA